MNPKYILYIFLISFPLSVWAGKLPVHDKEIFRLEAQDFPQLQTHLNESPLMLFWNSPAMENFRKPFDKDLEKTLKEIQQDLKLSEKPVLSDVFKGEVNVVLNNLNISVQENKLLSMGAYFIFDGGSSNNMLAEKIKEKMISKIEESEIKDGEKTRKDIKFMGEKFTTFTNTTKEKKSKKDQLVLPKNFQIWFGSINGYYYLGVGTKPEIEKTLTQLIKSIRKNSASKKTTLVQPSLKTSFKFGPILPMIHDAIEKAQKKKDEQEKSGKMRPGPGAMMTGIQLRKLFEATGLLDLNEMKMNINFDKAGMDGNFTMGMTQPFRGIWKLFLVSSLEEKATPFPNWLPEDTLTVTTMRFPISSWYTTIMDFLSQELPMIAGMVQQNMGGLKSQGMDLNKDIFQLFDDSFLGVQLTDSAKDPLVDTTVNMIKLKNGMTFEKNLLKVLSIFPLPLKLTPEEYMGGKVYPISTAGPSQSVVAFVKNWLLIGNSKSAVQKVIRLINHPPKKSLVDSRHFKVLSKEIPSHSHSISFNNMNEMLKDIISKLKKVPVRKQKDGDNSSNKMDFSKLPDPNDITIDLGSSIHSSISTGKSLEGKFKYIYQISSKKQTQKKNITKKK